MRFWSWIDQFEHSWTENLFVSPKTRSKGLKEIKDAVGERAYQVAKQKSPSTTTYLGIHLARTPKELRIMHS